MAAERAIRLAVGLAVAMAAGCVSLQGMLSPDLETAAKQGDALAVSDALEALIAEGQDTLKDREFAYEAVRAHEEDTAAYAFARAAVTGRYVQRHGLLGADLVADSERWALRSIELDPEFRDGAAIRLLGTLYVIAPATFVEQGDSERGLELLEGLVRDHPESLENHLRLAEAYITLDDPEPAAPHLCFCLEGRYGLRPDDQVLLDQLVAAAGSPDCAELP
jgi:hypothetical protein